MNKMIAILIGLIVLVFAVGGAVWFIRSKAPASSGTNEIPTVTVPADSDSSGTSQQAQSKSAVQAAFKSALGSNNPDNVIPTDTVIAGNYALQKWKGQITGGEALMKYDSTRGVWSKVMSSGGSFSAQELVDVGVSQEVATALVAGAGN